MAYQMGGSTCPRCGGTAEVRTVRELFDAMSGASDGFQRFSQQAGDQYGQPAGNPQFGQPAGQPQFGQPAGQPEFGQPAGQPQFGQPAGNPQFGQPAGQPQFGQPAGQQPGQPGAEQQGGPSSFGPNPFGPLSPGGQQPPNAAQGPGASQGPGAYQGPGQGQGQGRRWGWGRNSDDDYDHFNVEGSRNRNRNWRDRDLGDNIVDDIAGAAVDAALGSVGRAIGRRMMKAFEERVIPAVQARAAQAQQQFGQQRGELDAIASRYPELRGCLKDQVIFVDGGTRTVQISELTMPLSLAQADAVVARLR